MRSVIATLLQLKAVAISESYASPAAFFVKKKTGSNWTSLSSLHMYSVQGMSAAFNMYAVC